MFCGKTEKEVADSNAWTNGTGWLRLCLPTRLAVWLAAAWLVAAGVRGQLPKPWILPYDRA